MRVIWQDEKMGGLGKIGGLFVERDDGQRVRMGGLCRPEDAQASAAGLGLELVMEAPRLPHEAFLPANYYERLVS